MYLNETLFLDLDIDECLLNNGGCSDTCVNTVGGFECTCRPGYIVDTDNKTCTSKSCISLGCFPVLSDNLTVFVAKLSFKAKEEPHLW